MKLMLFEDAIALTDDSGIEIIQKAKINSASEFYELSELWDLLYNAKKLHIDIDICQTKDRLFFDYDGEKNEPNA